MNSGVGTLRLLVRFTERLAVFGLGIFSVWLIVFVVFRVTDRRLPWILAVSITYALAAYVILPRIVRMSLKILQRKSVPSFTLTGDGLPGVPFNGCSSASSEAPRRFCRRRVDRGVRAAPFCLRQDSQSFPLRSIVLSCPAMASDGAMILSDVRQPAHALVKKILARECPRLWFGLCHSMGAAVLLGASEAGAVHSSASC
jgi:hypothetical protein